MASKDGVGMGLPWHLLWLEDAPLFIDAVQIDQFYDAVVKPENLIGATIIELTEEQTKTLGHKLGTEFSVEMGGWLTSALGKLTGKVAAEMSGENAESKGHSSRTELQPISTAQRKLKFLTAYYLTQREDRLFFVQNTAAPEWRDPVAIRRVPRELVFLDLPSEEEAAERMLPVVKLIPAAAEFANGEIELIYTQLTSKSGETLPLYPESTPSEEPATVRAKRKTYWKWFDDNFSASRGMRAVEEAASKRGRIQWIDYRLPITLQGDTLHLHICPRGGFDTGVFAYNLIKRGFKHGVRLIGTLKSEPDMNVLAIYEK